MVFCRSLDLPYTSAELVRSYGARLIGVADTRVWFDKVDCAGSEAEIVECKLQVYAIDSQH